MPAFPGLSSSHSCNMSASIWARVLKSVCAYAESRYCSFIIQHEAHHPHFLSPLHFSSSVAPSFHLCCSCDPLLVLLSISLASSLHTPVASPHWYALFLTILALFLAPARVQVSLICFFSLYALLSLSVVSLYLSLHARAGGRVRASACACSL
eukprot:4093320-Pleurochrysis_carterae.AAC.3